MARIGRCCGLIPGPGSYEFRSIKNAKRFVELIDAGAGIKSFERVLKLTKKDVDFHITKLPIYRRTIVVFDELKRVTEQHQKGMTNITEYNEIAAKIKVRMWK